MQKSRLKYFWLLLLPVSLVVNAAATCDMTVSPLNFGNYNYLANDMQSSNGSIAVRCSGSSNELISYRIKITAGSSGDFSSRAMVSQGENLHYNIYLDPARTIVWGDGTGGSSYLTGSCRTGNTCRYPVYATILSSNNGVIVGNYTDNIQYILELK